MSLSFSRIGWCSAVAAALVWTGCSAPSSGRSSVHPASERRAAPNFALKDADGRTVQLSDYRGKVVLLNFWATWCGPCKMEIPWLVDFERKYKDKGFAVIGVSMDEDGWEVIKPFAQEASINYRILLGDDTVAQQYGGVSSLPTTFIIDREGKVAATHVGLPGRRDYEHDLEKVFEGSAAGVRNTSAGMRTD